MSDVTVVMYHYVRDLNATRFPKLNGLDIQDFRRQLDYFQHHYHFITIQDMIACMEGAEKLPDKAILLTFDDGYIDHFINVFPMLDERGIQGCFYPSAQSIVERCVLDVNKIHLIIASQNNDGNLLADCLKEEFCSQSNAFNVRSYDYYLKKYAKKNQYDSKEIIFFKRMLQVGLPAALRKIIIDRLLEKCVGVDETVLASELYMNEEQIKCMVRNGMHFGCHGFTHQWLNSLEPMEQEQEIVRSLSFLANVGVDTSSWSMTYPSGVYDASLIQIIQEKGCKIAFTVESGVGNCDNAERWYTPRLDTTVFRKTVEKG